jgi:GTP-binding protein LepA
VNHIRNFSIIAHIDHGKTTLSDRLLLETGTITERDFREQLLDSMDLERERGITIKSSAVSMSYKARDGVEYALNLIDTPGHVDFSYEVSRALAGCEGALLVVDATQGVQAQTLAHFYKALELNLDIIPVLNKIDAVAANVEFVSSQIEEELGLEADKIVLCSAKTGVGITDVLEAIVHRLPPPKGRPEHPLRALIFDSQYDAFRGAICHVRVVDGVVVPGNMMKVMSTGRSFKVEEVGRFKPGRVPVPALRAGDVGYIIGGIKNVSETPTGDTITLEDPAAAESLPGFVEAQSVVFSSLYPLSGDDFEELGQALSKLKLNDAALHFQKESSTALGFGFRCGFLGLLHADITQERLSREYGIDLMITAPSVQYRINMKTGETIVLENPATFPDPTDIKGCEEPYISASMIMPDRYLGSVMKLCMDRRATGLSHSYVGEKRIELRSEIPLAEVVYDFYDQLKSITQGYGSFDYAIIGFRPATLVKLEIRVNGDPVDALAVLLHKDRAYTRAREICERLKEEIPRHQFGIAIQGAIGGKIIARETISPFRKDVTAKCYGGDISRKRKLLEKQKEGKKRMRTFGNVAIPQRAFLAVLKTKTERD